MWDEVAKSALLYRQLLLLLQGSMLLGKVHVECLGLLIPHNSLLVEWFKSHWQLLATSTALRHCSLMEELGLGCRHLIQLVHVVHVLV